MNALLQPHAFDAPGDGFPACTVAGCGLPSGDAIHVTGRIRTRVQLVIDHDAKLAPAHVEAALLTILRLAKGLDVANSAVVP